jgi:hypothetical protein
MSMPMKPARLHQSKSICHENFVGIAVGILHPELVNSVVKSIGCGRPSGPARGTNFDFCEFGAGFSSFQDGRHRLVARFNQFERI